MFYRRKERKKFQQDGLLVATKVITASFISSDIHKMTPREKRFKRDVTLIEYLPNELFLEVFNYLTDVDAVCAFSRLNTRFQSLTLDYCYALDFQSVSKAKFDYVIRQHDIHRWRSLRLSDDDKTPGQVTHFCRLFSFAEHISQLQTLSLINIKSSTALLFLPQLTSCTHLVSLSLGSVCGNSIPNLQLPSLKHLVINSCMHSKWMTNLRLESLQHTIEHHCTHEHDLTWPNSLKQLKIFLARSGDSEIVRVSLGHLSELTSLAVYDSAWESSPPDGQIWEKLITSSMPVLKKFEFCFKFWKDFNLSSDITQIVTTFSTPFYLKEKSWFIQCDSHHQQLSIALLYSLPYAFERFEIVTHSFDESVTTCSTHNFNKNFYKNVKTLMVDVTCKKINETLISGNVAHLSLKSPGTPMDWIFSITGLRQISFANQIDMSPREFIRLLKNTPHLHSLNAPYYILKLFTDQWKNKIACALLSRKIQSLNISSDGGFRDYVKVDELVHIVRIFHERCQHLNVTVYSRNMVAGLILRNMQQLRSLKVRLKEHGNDFMITKKWLIEQNIAYKNLDCSIVVDENEYSFWFGRRR